MTGNEIGMRRAGTQTRLPEGTDVMNSAAGPDNGNTGRDALRERKRSFLEQYRYIDTEISRLMEERDEWFARATKITANYGPAPGRSSREGDRLGGIVAKLTELDGLIDRNVDELVDLRLEIEAAIKKIDDPVLRNLLALKYINGLNFEQTAERLFYSLRQVMNLHAKALDALGI